MRRVEGGGFLGQESYTWRREYGRRGRHRTGGTNEPGESRKEVQGVGSGRKGHESLQDREDRDRDRGTEAWGG